jgi:alcohol dehydrogenase class IV
MEQIKPITFRYPHTLVFGPHSLKQLTVDYLKLGHSRLYIVTVASVMDQLLPILDTLKSNGIAVKLNYTLNSEPTFNDLESMLSEARLFQADSIAGIGGGSVMDTAKLVAALLKSEQNIKSIVGNGLLTGRNTWLACIPTTSGTGSEVSPNAILLDEKDHAKKGIISPFLVPDNAYIDPMLTLSVPSAVTAYTGIDALTHCIEAYANLHAHPMADTLALDGISLIGRNLKQAVLNGLDVDARSKVALGSVYGGMCLGPVNTAAVHALAYPLGAGHKIPHGLSNAVLLPYIIEFNLNAATDRYAAIALAMGAKKGQTPSETAQNGISLIRTLLHDCNVPLHLSEIGISQQSIPSLAKSAMEVQRLLKNNVREITLEDAISIYTLAY